MASGYLSLNVLLLKLAHKDQALENASIAELNYFSSSSAIVFFEGEYPYFPLKKICRTIDSVKCYIHLKI